MEYGEEFPLISVIIPCYNESRNIGPCLDSIIANDFPRERIDVIVVDGESDDGTLTVVEHYAKHNSFIRIIPNKKRIFPSAVNLGITHAQGDLIIIMSAHATCQSDYIRNCVTTLLESGADNVGGVLVTVPGSPSLTARAIALTLSHPFGSLNARFRVGTRIPRYADTVAFGCYRRELFEEIGMFREELTRSSDMEFNTRLRRQGGKILLVPNIVAYYKSDANFTRFLRHNLADGFWAIYPIALGFQPFSFRHIVPAFLLTLFLSCLILSVLWKPVGWASVSFVAAYCLISAFVAVRHSWKERVVAHILLLPIAFAIRHSAYGVGSLMGVWRVLTARRVWKGIFGRISTD